MDNIVVHKFGGSCLRERNDIDRIAETIKNFDGTPIVVVSAVWGMTDRLMRAANEPRFAGRLVRDLRFQHLLFAPGLDQGPFSKLFESVLNGISKELVKLTSDEPSIRSKNLILAAGERLSALVVAHRLREFGLNTHPVGAEDVGLKLKGKGISSRIDMERSNKFLDREALIGIPILTGWFGEGEDGEIAILSRGGSDHSAAAIANLMNASKLILWKDVDGIKQLNPRWGIETDSIPYLGYNEATELSKHGTSVIHPATVIPLISEGIPLEIRNMNSDILTLAPTIVGPDLKTENNVKAIGCKPGVAIIKHDSPLSSEILAILEDNDVTTWHVESSPDSLRIILPNYDLHHLEGILSGEIEHWSAIITVIGSNSIQLDCEHKIISQNENNVRILIRTENLSQTLAKLHQSLFSRQDCK